MRRAETDGGPSGTITTSRIFAQAAGKDEPVTLCALTLPNFSRPCARTDCPMHAAREPEQRPQTDSYQRLTVAWRDMSETEQCAGYREGRRT